jgi:lipopolysaccharide assembly protein A
MIIFIIAAMVIAVLAVIFALQNTATVTVGFLVWSLQGSQALVLLAAVFAGIAVCFLACLPSWIRHRWTIRRLRKRVTTLELSLSDQETATNEAKQKLREQETAISEAKQKLSEQETAINEAQQKLREQALPKSADEPPMALPPPAQTT